MLATRGVNVTIADAHVAQCALDRGATLVARDDIFPLIATHTSLRLAQLR
jgi:predicted nucleic acid-binding protein